TMRRHRWEPTKPVAPVISTRIRSASSSSDRGMRVLEPDPADREQRARRSRRGNVGESAGRAIESTGSVVVLQDAPPVDEIAREKFREAVQGLNLSPRQVFVPHRGLVAVDVGVFVDGGEALADGPVAELGPDERRGGRELDPVRLEANGEGDGLED